MSVTVRNTGVAPTRCRSLMLLSRVGRNLYTSRVFRLISEHHVTGASASLTLKLSMTVRGLFSSHAQKQAILPLLFCGIKVGPKSE